MAEEVKEEKKFPWWRVFKATMILGIILVLIAFFVGLAMVIFTFFMGMAHQAGTIKVSCLQGRPTAAIERRRNEAPPVPPCPATSRPATAPQLAPAQQLTGTTTACVQQQQPVVVQLPPQVIVERSPVIHVLPEPSYPPPAMYQPAACYQPAPVVYGGSRPSINIGVVVGGRGIGGYVNYSTIGGGYGGSYCPSYGPPSYVGGGGCCIPPPSYPPPPIYMGGCRR